jgi:predicted amidophosphoribosyltransferase
MMTETAQSTHPAAPKCPVCRAGFRGSTTCSRCGTDLKPVMQIAAEAWAAQERCRAALRDGNLALALKWAARGRQLRDSSAAVQ